LAETRGKRMAWYLVTGGSGFIGRLHDIWEVRREYLSEME
jgi:hypothetical protein